MPSLTVSQEDPAGPLTGAELVRIVQGGNSRRTTAQQMANLAGTANRVSLLARGVNPSGTVDVTAAVQLAIDNVAALGGGIVDCSGGRWLIDSADLIVKQGVTLWGPWLNLGEPDGQDYSNIQSAFIVNPLYTIRLAQEFAAIKGLGIFRKGLTNPTTIAEALTEIAAFAGNGITVGYGVSKDASDTYVGYCHVLGFNQLYFNDFNERPRVEYVSGDCTNGIVMARIYDMAHIMNCHLWPFVTAHKAFTLTNDIWRRQGTGYRIGALTKPDDWGQAYGCFDYGHDIGFDIYDSSNVVLTNCGSDNWRTAGDTYSIGFQARGNCENVNLIGCKAAAKYRNLSVNLSSSSPTLKMIGGNLWGSVVTTGRAVDVIAGNVILDGVSFFDTPTAVTTGASAGQVSIDNCSFASVTTPFSINNENAVLIGSGNVFNGTVTDPTYGRRFSTNGNAFSFETAYSASNETGIVARRARGTMAAPTTIVNGDVINRISYAGWDGTNWTTAASLRGQAGNAVSAGNVPGAFVFATRNAAGVFSDRISINPEGVLAPTADNTLSMGASTFRWASSYVIDAHTFPLASVTPTINGELVVERTSNTSVTLKLRGTDGTTRTSVLTFT